MLGDTGFEAHRGAGGNIEPVAVSRGAVEVQRGVGLWQVHMTADLNRPIARVDDLHLEPLRTGIDRDIAVAVDDFTWDHWIGSWTVTSLVPSGKVASTWTS